MKNWKNWLGLGLILGWLLSARTFAANNTSVTRSESQLFPKNQLSIRPQPECDEVLVRLDDRIEARQAQSLLARHGQVVRQIPRIDVWVLADCQRSAVDLARELAQREGVTWAEPNGRYYAQGIIPNDNFYQAQQENLRLMGLPEAWVFTTGDASPIAIIDSGLDLDHHDLEKKIWVNPGEVPGNGLDDDQNGYVDDVHGWNFINGSTLFWPDQHGSHVAGIAGAHTDNGIGVAGVAWTSPLMALQALRGTSGEWDDLAEAIVYAADNDARILNLSVGGREPSQTIRDAVAYARSRGCLLVASAGNRDGQDTSVLYPAAFPEVMAVAATTNSDAPWLNSNRGPEVDVAAPGVEIFSTSSYGRYAVISGTSMSAPHVSGLAALIWSFQPSLTADQVTHVITSTARDVYAAGWDERTGWGRVDAQAALLHLAQPHVELVADRYLVAVGEKGTGTTLLLENQSAQLTATVTYDQGQPVPDGLAVKFLTTLGHVSPPSVNTKGGQVTAIFTSTQGGPATVTAQVGAGFQDDLPLFVFSDQFYLPLVTR